MNYEILPVSAILNDVSDIHKQLIKIDTETMAKVYRGNSGFYYIIPAVGPLGIKGEKKIIDSIVDSKRIPIEEKNPSIFQNNSFLIPTLNQKCKSVVDSFIQEYNLNLKDIETGNYDKLNQVVNRIKGKSRHDKFLFYLGLLIGYLKMKNNPNYNWSFEKRYGYNPYFEPYISDATKVKKINPWYSLSRELLSKGKFQFQIALNDLLVIDTQ